MNMTYKIYTWYDPAKSFTDGKVKVKWLRNEDAGRSYVTVLLSETQPARRLIMSCGGF
jgi:hypothetical protein